MPLATICQKYFHHHKIHRLCWSCQSIHSHNRNTGAYCVLLCPNRHDGFSNPSHSRMDRFKLDTVSLPWWHHPILNHWTTVTYQCLRTSPAGQLCAYTYTSIAFAALFGWPIWNEVLLINTWIGIFIIVFAGILAIKDRTS